MQPNQMSQFGGYPTYGGLPQNFSQMQQSGAPGQQQYSQASMMSGRRQGQASTDTVVKFLLKLRNNNLNNLKNALRKLGEKTQGKKDELLLRLANKLATPEGKQMVKSSFKPEIYKDLYEVEIQDDVATSNGSNPVYNFYRNMVPPQHQTGGGGGDQASHRNAQMQQQLQQYPGQQPQRQQVKQMQQMNTQAVNQQFYRPSSGQQPTLYKSQVPPLQGHPQQQQQSHKKDLPQQLPPQQKVTPRQPQNGGQAVVIDLDDDAPSVAPSTGSTVAPSSSNRQQRSNLPSFPSISAVQQQSAVSGRPFDPNVGSINQITIPQIKSASAQSKVSCLLDEPYTKPIYCFCEAYSSLYVASTNQNQQHKQITCTKCGINVHASCQEKNQFMQKSNLDRQQVFVCHMCQFKEMDPLQMPIATLLRPFLVPKLTTQEVKMYQRRANTGKDFVMKEQWYSEINKASNFGQSRTLRVQVRCLRLDGVGFEHSYPKYGHSSLNNSDVKSYTTPDPPNDQKKRKDEMQDITSTVTRGKNRFDIYQEQRNHKGFFAHPGQVCAIFLVRVIDPRDLLAYVRSQGVEDPKTSLTRAKQFFQSQKQVDNDIAIQEAEESTMISLNTACPFTYITIAEAARGEHCLHLQCFDLSTYVNMNAKHKRWQCPICNRRTLKFSKDLFYQEILTSHTKIQQQDFQVEDKFCIDAKVGLIVQKCKGKVKDRYSLVEKDGVATGFVLETPNWKEGGPNNGSSEGPQKPPSGEAATMQQKPATPSTNVTTSDSADKITPEKSNSPADGGETLSGSKRLSKDATAANNNPEDGTAQNGIKKARVQNEANMQNPIALD